MGSLWTTEGVTLRGTVSLGSLLMVFLSGHEMRGFAPVCAPPLINHLSTGPNLGSKLFFISWLS